MEPRVWAPLMAKRRNKLLAKVRGYFDNKPRSGQPPSSAPESPCVPLAGASSTAPSVRLHGRPIEKPHVPPPVEPNEMPNGRPLGRHPGQPLGKPLGRPHQIPGLGVTVVGDTLRVWQASGPVPQFDPLPDKVAGDFLCWLERTLPERKFVPVDELGLLYYVFCSISWGRQRYPLSPLILKYLGTMTRKQQKDIRTIEGKVFRNRVHYLVGPVPVSGRAPHA